MKKHVVTGPIQRLSQCHRTITNSYSYSWIQNQMFLLIHFEIQELWVIITTNSQTQPENFHEILHISRRFPEFPGVLDTLQSFRHNTANFQLLSACRRPQLRPELHSVYRSQNYWKFASRHLRSEANEPSWVVDAPTWLDYVTSPWRHADAQWRAADKIISSVRPSNTAAPLSK